MSDDDNPNRVDPNFKPVYGTQTQRTELITRGADLLDAGVEYYEVRRLLHQLAPEIWDVAVLAEIAAMEHGDRRDRSRAARA